eukprot:scaffold45106_cov54-Phaeocystis_antarctica.AAC.2
MPVHVGSAVLVTGDTYEKKAKLIAIGRDLCRKARVAQASASWRSGGSCQRQSMPLAAPSFGPPRPISRFGRAGRPYQGLGFDIRRRRPLVRRALVQAAERMDLSRGQARSGGGRDGRRHQ